MKNLFNSLSLDTWQTLLRSVCKIGGGYLIAHNLATGDQANAILGGAMAAAAVAWGVIHHASKPNLTGTQPTAAGK